MQYCVKVLVHPILVIYWRDRGVRHPVMTTLRPQRDEVNENVYIETIGQPLRFLEATLIVVAFRSRR